MKADANNITFRHLNRVAGRSDTRVTVECKFDRLIQGQGQRDGVALTRLLGRYKRAN